LPSAGAARTTSGVASNGGKDSGLI
jgi:hypothetical protein